MGPPPLLQVDEGRGPATPRLPDTVSAFIGPLPALAGQGPIRAISYPDALDRIGPPPPQPMSVRITRRLDADGRVLDVTAEWQEGPPSLPAVVVHHALATHFRNGGDPVWIVPTVGGGAEDLLAGLRASEGLADVTLLVMPDAVHLSAHEWGRVTAAALASCARIGTRLIILDVPDARPSGFAGWGATGATFRAALAGVPTGALDYGAAYAPFLQTAVEQAIDDTALFIGEAWDEVVAADGTIGRQAAPALVGLSLSSIGAIPGAVALRQAVHDLAWTAPILLPPSGVVSGLFGKTDRDLGLWRTPDDQALAAALKPSVPVLTSDMDLLRDPATGGAINPFRSLPGRGVRLFGARTLAGQGSEVRHVPQRRLLMGIKASLTEALAPLVFEPNTPPTWTHAQRLISDFLVDLWHRGALQGRTPNEAFFVRIGPGTTMTQADIDAGRLVAELGVATLRPAEFVILRLIQATAGA